MAKAAKGTVTIESVKNRLRLYWRVAGERYYLTLGYPDTPKHRAIAQLKANRIQEDLLFGRFDPSLEKYRPGAQSTPKTVSLREIWDRFVEYKRPQCSPSTMRSQYKSWTNHVAKLPTDSPYEAGTIRAWLMEYLTIGSAKRVIGALSDCMNWAIGSGLVDRNVFSGMAMQIKLPKSVSKKEMEDIDPFTKEEIEKILDLFKTNKYYKHYYSFVLFLFLTGCRPSEALALQWKHIDRRYHSITFEQGLVMGEDGLTIKGGLKTQERRGFPCNQPLKDLLKAMPKTTPDVLLFPSPRNGKYIDFHNFANRAWKTILQQAGIRYRKPYQTRHTFITLALQELSVQDVAKLCGNSPETIYKHYAGISRDLEVPVLF